MHNIRLVDETGHQILLQQMPSRPAKHDFFVWADATWEVIDSRCANQRRVEPLNGKQIWMETFLAKKVSSGARFDITHLLTESGGK